MNWPLRQLRNLLFTGLQRWLLCDVLNRHGRLVKLLCIFVCLIQQCALQVRDFVIDLVDFAL